MATSNRGRLLLAVAGRVVRRLSPCVRLHGLPLDYGSEGVQCLHNGGDGVVPPPERDNPGGWVVVTEDVRPSDPDDRSRRTDIGVYVVMGRGSRVPPI